MLPVLATLLPFLAIIHSFYSATKDQKAYYKSRQNTICRTKFRPFGKVETNWTFSICFDVAEKTKFRSTLLHGVDSVDGALEMCIVWKHVCIHGCNVCCVACRYWLAKTGTRWCSTESSHEAASRTGVSFTVSTLSSSSSSATVSFAHCCWNCQVSIFSAHTAPRCRRDYILPLWFFLLSFFLLSFFFFLFQRLISGVTELISTKLRTHIHLWLLF